MYMGWRHFDPLQNVCRSHAGSEDYERPQIFYWKESPSPESMAKTTNAAVRAASSVSPDLSRFRRQYRKEHQSTTTPEKFSKHVVVKMFTE